MKAKNISIEIDDFKLKGPAERMVQLFALGMLAQTLPPAANVQPVTVSGAPAIGEYWIGQGGINAGYVAACGDVPAHYLILGDEDLGEFKWGRYQEESAATSKWDGKANTDALIAAGNHPAAESARAYTADGHSDFDLPAAAQLHQAWAYDLISKGYYWSSSQRSAYSAFGLHFGAGVQYGDGKDGELRVRPVRRYFI
ncbi:hypothetical protein PVE_R1G1985 [Pseudomonas veronii 1YdBTEX2]|uniref:DUF1566 domain-containing protein n=1 Tax=Pseudomonas veronii 1YdBTEX2 TaxID=1295141 RepID=A0A1D3JV97_PSEVE|nr:DUF1566 domain-containing protein [Pseudomonas veronii]SBW79871.1 hypothetical protein PVE_R1G1985 [Pseudomonas veronii 1YdBTEX2]